MSAEYPISVCRYRGSMAMVLYRTIPSTVIRTVPTAKLRFRRMRRSTMGWSVRSSRTMKAVSETVVITANQRTQVAANQSSSCPLSSMIWRVARPTAMRANPR